MREVEIRYRFFEIKREEDRIRELVESMLFLIPRWVHCLSFDRYGNSDGDGSAASVNNEREYRFAVVSINDKFFTAGDDRHALMLIHELIHLQHAQVYEWMRDRVLAPMENTNEDLHFHCKAEFMERVEGFTQDMAYAIHELMYPRLHSLQYHD